MVKIVFVEGNVASGKTTGLNYLEKRARQRNDKHVLFLKEPVDHWQDLLSIDGNRVNLLQTYYEDIPKYGFCFQTYAFLSRMKPILDKLQQINKSSEDKSEVIGKSLIICERSIFTDREIFLESLYNNGQVTEQERTVYHQLWNFWINLMRPYFSQVDLEFLYILCTPQKNFDHLHTRGREEEQGVQIEYLQGLHQKHENLYNGHSTVVLDNLVTTLTGRTETAKITRLENLRNQEDFYQELDNWYDNLSNF